MSTVVGRMEKALEDYDWVPGEDGKWTVRSMSVLNAMREPSPAAIRQAAMYLDIPNVYMGGPSQRSIDKATNMWRIMIDATIKEGEDVEHD